MADIEKVKNGIKNCIEEKHPCASCEYKKRQGCTGWLLKDAMSVIDELQAEIERLKAVINHDPDCANAEHDSGGCLGYSGSHDDEPIEECKNCEKYTGNTSKDGDGDAD